MQLGVSEIFDRITKEQDPIKRQNMLASHGRNQGVIAILQLAYDPRYVWNLPEGDPPYKPCQFLDQQGMLYSSIKTMYLFLGEGNPRLPAAKKEAMFINMLESLDPADAKLLLAVKAKKMPYEGITEDLVRKTFPELLPPPVTPADVVSTKKKKAKKNEQEQEAAS